MNVGIYTEYTFKAGKYVAATTKPNSDNPQ